MLKLIKKIKSSFYITILRLKTILTVDFISGNILENLIMNFNQNERYLLRFICTPDNHKPDIVEIVSKLGLKPKFSDYNPVYQIIDELYYSDYFCKRT